MMPTYNYTCEACERGFQRNLPLSQRKIPLDEPCPSCGLCRVRTKVDSVHTVTGIKGAHSQSESFKDTLRNIDKLAGKESTIDV